MVNRPPHDQRDKVRRNIAAGQKRQLRAAMKACGPAKAYGRWSLTDRLGLEPVRSVYCARYEGHVGWHPSAEEAFGELLNVAIDAAIDWPLRRGYWGRYSLSFSGITDYNPVPAAALDARKAKRKAKQQKTKMGKMLYE